MKKFLVVGNFNAVAWKDVFPLIRSGDVHLGMGRRMSFSLPDGEVCGCNSCWYTNLDFEKPIPFIDLADKYDPLVNPKYDNYDAIEVSRTENIPCDYDGVMGVPITFLDRFNSSQFELIVIAAGNSLGNFKDELISLNFNPEIRYGGGLGACVLNGKAKFARVMIRRRKDALQHLGFSL